MPSFIENCKTLLESNANAIVLCNEQMVLQNKTYKEIIDICDVITKVLPKFILEQHICLGLLMNHNVYIPSIILSFQRLKYAFVFITPKNLNGAVADLKLNWILSLEDAKEIERFENVHTFKVDEKNSLIVWRRNLLVVADFNYLNIFCVVQTSGSTGERKIIRVSNTCIESNASALRKLFDINSKDVIYWGTALTFDPSLIELLLALHTGASLLIVPYNVSINSSLLYKVLFAVNRITFLQMVPSLFLRWNEDQIKNILNSSNLRILAFGGEAFPKSVLRYPRKSKLRIFNLYGISEVSCWATAHEISGENCDDDIPIGKNLQETLLELRDKDGKTVNHGKGEIFIGSSSRICYVNNEIVEEICKPEYRETGDIAEINEKGIFLMGRKNRIIKRFGHRINLTKMELVILKETGLENKCVWSQENKKILTFILIKSLHTNIKEKTLDKLRTKLLNILSEESLPDFIEIVENFPLTSHGKIDEKTLVRYYLVPKTTSDSVEVFSHLWCKYFGIGQADFDKIKNCTFFEMGGNSILVLQFLEEFKMLKLEYPSEIVTMIFEENLENCLNLLKTVKPTRKRSNKQEAIAEQHIKKKERILDGLKILWSYDLKACVDGAPIAFEKTGSVYVTVGSFSHIFVILNESGEDIYKKVLPQSIESTPSISTYGDYILVGCYNGIMYCVNFVINQIIWEYQTCGKIKGSACFCKNQSAVVFGSYDKKIYCVSVENGLNIWQIALDGSISSNPLCDVTGKRIFTATTSGTCFCLNESNGKIIWKYKCGAPVFGTCCLLNSNQNVVFPSVQGLLHCLSAKNGEILWTFQAHGHIFSSLVLYNNCLLFGCHDKNVYIVKVTPFGCDLVGKVTLDSEISSTPFPCNIRGNDVVAAACNSGVIYVVDFKTCIPIHSMQLSSEVFSSPFVYKSKIYVGCRDNNLYCIEINV